MRRMTDKDIPKLPAHVNSWALIRTATNECIAELPNTPKNRRALKSLNADNVHLVRIDHYLASLNTPSTED